MSRRLESILLNFELQQKEQFSVVTLCANIEITDFLGAFFCWNKFGIHENLSQAESPIGKLICLLALQNIRWPLYIEQIK